MCTFQSLASCDIIPFHVSASRRSWTLIHWPRKFPPSPRMSQSQEHCRAMKYGLNGKCIIYIYIMYHMSIIECIIYRHMSSLLLL